MQVSQQQVALPREPVPRVAEEVEAGVLRDRRVEGAQLRGVEVGEADRGDHHLVADELPAHAVGLGGLEAVEEPSALGLAEDRPSGGCQLGRQQVEAQGTEQAAGGVRVAVLAGVEAEDLAEVAPAQRSVDAAALDRPDGHVLEPRLERRGHASGVEVQHRAVPVVRHLVVVPHGQQRVGGVAGLQVGVGPVEAVALPVALDRLGGLERLVADTALQLDEQRLVDVVAEEQDGVEVLCCDVAPRSVEAGGVRLAAGHPEGQPRGGGARRGQRASAPDGRDLGAGPEPVPPAAVGGEAAHQHLHAVVARRRDRSRAARDHVGEGVVGGDLPLDARGAGGEQRLHPGPQHDLARAVEPRCDAG